MNRTTLYWCFLVFAVFVWFKMLNKNRVAFDAALRNPRRGISLESRQRAVDNWRDLFFLFLEALLLLGLGASLHGLVKHAPGLFVAAAIALFITYSWYVGCIERSRNRCTFYRQLALLKLKRAHGDNPVATSEWYEIWKIDAHPPGVGSVAFSPDGTLLASAGGDGKVRLWRTSDGELLCEMEGHTGPVTAAAFSPDGTTIASGSFDKTVRVWDVSSGHTLHTLDKHTGPVLTVAFPPAFPSFDYDMMKEDLGDTTAYVIRKHYSRNAEMLASGSADHTVRIWRASDGKPVCVFDAHQDPVYSLCFGAWGWRLATASGGLAQVTPSSIPLTMLRGSGALHDSVMRSWTKQDLGFKPSARGDGLPHSTIRLWKVPQGLPMGTIQAGTDTVWCVRFSPDGTLVASSGWWGKVDNPIGCIQVWRSRDAKPLRIITDPLDLVWALAFSPDGAILAAGGTYGMMHLWRVRDGKRLHTIRGHTAQVQSVAFAPDGATLASGGFDGKVRLWRVPDR